MLSHKDDHIGEVQRVRLSVGQTIKELKHLLLRIPQTEVNQHKCGLRMPQHDLLQTLPVGVAIPFRPFHQLLVFLFVFVGDECAFCDDDRVVEQLRVLLVDDGVRVAHVHKLRSEVLFIDGHAILSQAPQFFARHAHIFWLESLLFLIKTVSYTRHLIDINHMQQMCQTHCNLSSLLSLLFCASGRIG